MPYCKPLFPVNAWRNSSSKDSPMTKTAAPPPTVITLTLPTPHDGGIPEDERTASLLIQRGDLAHLRQFHYHGYLPDVMDAIREATEALSAVEDNPPVIPETKPPAARPTSKAGSKPTPKPEPEEPTIPVPLKKSSIEVKISHLKIVGGETDAAAYRQAVLIAGRLIDGKLWDGTSPIRIDDVYVTLKKMKHLTDKDFSLFALTDFVQVGNAEQDTQETNEAAEVTDDIVDITDGFIGTETDLPTPPLKEPTIKQPDLKTVSTNAQVD